MIIVDTLCNFISVENFLVPWVQQLRIIFHCELLKKYIQHREATKTPHKATTAHKTYQDFSDIQQGVSVSRYQPCSVSITFTHWTCCHGDEAVAFHQLKQINKKISFHCAAKRSLLPWWIGANTRVVGGVGAHKGGQSTSAIGKDSTRNQNKKNVLVLGSVHTTPGKFENVTLFLRFGLPSTLIRRHENGAFGKRCSNRRKFKTPGFLFRVDGKHFWKRSFPKTMGSRQSCDFPDRGFLRHKSKMTGNC